MKLKRRFGVVLLMAMLVMAMTVTASAAKKVKLNKKSATLSIGKTVTLRVKNAGKKKVTWASSDVYVATVDDGVVTAVDAGTATIRATVGAKTLKCKVTVKAAAEQASVQFARYSTFEPRLLLNGSLNNYRSDFSDLDTKVTDALVGGTKYDLKPHVDVTPANATLTWTSSNEKVATVKDGVVTAVANGTAKITVSANGASDSIVVFVQNMGSDEDSNPVVITAANYDRLFNKFFEKVEVTTVWLDVNGNIMNPSTLEKAWIGAAKYDDAKATHLEDYIKKNFVEKKYYYVVKDSRVDSLKSSGSGILKYWITWNELTSNGGTPVLKPTNDKIAWTNNQSGYYQDNITKINEFKLDNAGNIPFKYTHKVWDPDKNKGKGDYEMLEDAGLCKVIVSDPSLAGKAVLGFQYGYTNDALEPIFDGPRDSNGKLTGAGKYYMFSYTDEVFTACQFTLYLK